MLSSKFFNRNYVLFFATLIAILSLYYQSTFSLFTLWVLEANPSYSHGSLLSLLAAYAVFLRFKELGELLKPDPNFVFIIIIFVLSLFWALLVISGIKVGHQFVFIGLVYLLFWALFDYRAAIYLSAPVIIVFFAVPVWEIFNQGHLQVITAGIVSELLEFTGIVVYRDGINIQIPAGIFEVSQTCSGMRQLVVAPPIALVFASMSHLRIVWIVASVILSILIAMISNITRIYIVVLSGQLTDMQHYFVREDHVTLGWIVFSVYILLFILFGVYAAKKYPWLKKTPIDKILFTSRKHVGEGWHRKIAYPVLIIALLSGPLSVYAYHKVSIDSLGKYEIELAVTGGWQDGIKTDMHFAQISDAQGIIQASFYNKNDIVNIEIYRYSYQHDGHELYAPYNQVIDKQKWKIVNSEIVAFEENGKTHRVRESLIKNENSIYLVWSWYRYRGLTTVSGATLRLENMRGVLLGDTSASLQIIATPVLSNTQNAREVIDGFLGSNFENINQALNAER